MVLYLPAVFLLTFFVIILSWILTQLFFHRRPPGPWSNFLNPLGALQKIVSTASTNHILFSKWHDEYGPVYTVRVVSRWIYFIGSSETIDQLYRMTKQFPSRGNGGMKYFVPQSLLGFTSCNKQWKDHRRLISGAFTDFYVKKDSQEIISAGNKLTETISNSAGMVADINELMAATAYGILCNTVLGKSWTTMFSFIGSQAEMAAALATSNKLSYIPESLWDWVSFESKTVAVKFQALQRNKVKSNLATIRRDNIQDDTMLHFMAHHSSNMTDDEIADELMALVMAGHETTANTLSFALVCLATHPVAQQRVRDETLTVCDHNVEKLSYEHLKELPYLWAVLRETLRLFPTVPINGRVAEDTVVMRGGEVIPKGATVLINTFHLCRSEENFENATQFKPERQFNCATHNFGGGLRVCVGKRFAEEEIILLLAHILAHFKVTLHSVGSEVYSPEMVNRLNICDLPLASNVTMTFAKPIGLQFHSLQSQI